VEAHDIDVDLLTFTAFDQIPSEYSIVDVVPANVKTFALQPEH
jgi:hypothetical protein